jgi:hypothetical protein
MLIARLPPDLEFNAFEKNRTGTGLGRRFEGCQARPPPSLQVAGYFRTPCALNHGPLGQFGGKQQFVHLLTAEQRSAALRMEVESADIRPLIAIPMMSVATSTSSNVKPRCFTVPPAPRAALR